MQIQALLTDSYQLAMMQSYLEGGMTESAAFEFFARRMPEDRGYLIAAGLEQLLDYLEGLRFTDEDLAWLNQRGIYRPAFLEYLRHFKFTGDVIAVPEGTPFFADEPIVRVVAPLPQAQLVESRLVNILHFQTLIASKAARCYLVSKQKPLIEFGMRRAQGAEAALYAARASYIGGFSATSDVQASERFGIHVSGTMAHSFIEAHESEEAAFRHFARTQIGPITLLIDTYDTEAGAEKVARMAPELMAAGVRLRSVRIDSGDLGEHARRVRAILDSHGLNQIRIFASGSLDEFEIERLLKQGAPIDGFGVGTKLTTSADVPYLDCAYKIQDYAGHPKQKTSEGKATWPGRKQVWRQKDSCEQYLRDTLRLQSEEGEGVPLLFPVMRRGRRLEPPTPLEQIREHCLSELGHLPPELLRLKGASDRYPVEISRDIRELSESLKEQVRRAA